MSSTPSASENAASGSVDRPSNGSRDPRDGDQHKNPRWIPPPRTKSTSLLTRALATHHEVDETLDATATTSSSKTSNPPSHNPSHITPPHQDGQSRTGLTSSTGGSPSTPDNTNMAVVASAGEVRPGVSLGGASSSPSSIWNLNNIDSLITSNFEALNNHRGRGTSLERTEREKRTQELPNGVYNTNPGDTGMTRAVTSLSSTASTSISNNHPTEGVRAHYRSWRDVRPSQGTEKAWSIGGKGDGNDHGGQVEKSIKNALAGVEPNNRSRKASHSMGFFKEGLPDDGSRSRDAKNRGRSKEDRPRGKPSASADTTRTSMGYGCSPSDQLIFHGWARSVDRNSPLEPSFEPKRATTSHEQIVSDLIGKVSTEGDYFDIPRSNDVMQEEKDQKIPPQLLAEIQKHHNLTPGAPKGSSFSASIPVTESEKESTNASARDLRREDHIQSDETELTRVKSADEEEDSGEERVTSALFVVHQTPHDSPGHAKCGSDESSPAATSDQQKADIPAAAQQWLEKLEVPSQDIPEKYRIQDTKSRPSAATSEDERRQLHGGASSTVQHQEIAGKQVESLSRGEYKIHAEDETLGNDDTTARVPRKTESSEESGPTQSTNDSVSIPDPNLLCDSVQLIPYGHQVGGHTTMFRFSPRSVCKQLNSRENEFYEKVENYHPKLLPFLPRPPQTMYRTLRLFNLLT